MKLISKLYREEQGVTLIEYGLIAALIAMAVVVALTIAGEQVKNFYESLANDLEDAYLLSQ